MAVAEWVADVARAEQSRDGDQLAQLITLNPADPRLGQLYHEVLQVGEYRRIIEGQKWQTKALDQVLVAYLDALRNSNTSDTAQQFLLIQNMINAAISAFAGSSSGWMSPLIKSIASLYASIATKADCASKNLHMPCVNDASRALFRLFNVILSDRIPTEGPSKRACTLRIANLLFRLYFRMNQIRLCSTIHQNIMGSGVQFQDFVKADRVTYRYYLGRYYLSQTLVHRAHSHLLYAFHNCHKDLHGHRRKILIYLVPCSMILGIVPRQLGFLEQFGLQNHYGMLIEALKRGDFLYYQVLLDCPGRREWYIKTGVYLLLKDRAQLLLFRNLFRKVFLLTYQPTHRTTYVEGKRLLEARQWVVTRQPSDYTPEDDYDMDDIECACISLLDQGYIKGYVMHSTQVLVLKKDENFGFQKIRTVAPAIAPSPELQFFQDES